MANVIYDRQRTLSLNTPKSATVIGCGGVGSWVALNLALVGVGSLVIVDYDIIEEHNLNRTPFKHFHIGFPKVTALAELIYERRPDIQLLPIVKTYGDLEEIEMKLISKSEVIVDCRDTMEPPLASPEKQLITGGYDGYNITLHIHPTNKSIWGDNEEPMTYRVTPSFIVPPLFLSSLIVLYITAHKEIGVDSELVKTFDIRTIFDILKEVVITDAK